MSSVRHHFVPQGYLRGFVEEGNDDSRSFIWVYDKQFGRQPRKKSIRSIAWAPAYYSQEREDGSADNDSLENALAKTIDNEIPKIISRIKAVPGQLVSLDEESRGALAYFIGLSLTRVPSFRDGINDFHTQIAQITLSHLSERDPEIAEGVSKYDIKAEAKPWVSLEAMFRVAEQVGMSALSKSWQFFIPPKEVSLVTSDNPVVFSGGAAELSELGPAHPGAELVMNLRKDLAIVCTPKRGYPSMKTFALSSSEARKFNRGVVRAARQRVFADRNSSTLDGFVKKYAGEEQRIVA